MLSYFTLPESRGERRQYDIGNIRYRCYSLLADVTYHSEPVVPAILSPSEEQKIGSRFQVEDLAVQGAVELGEYIADLRVSLQDKLKALLETCRQYRAIDAAGYVLFDRNPNNIMVIPGEEGVSVRQVDVEDLYVKETGEVITSAKGPLSEDLLAVYKLEGIPFWQNAVYQLIDTGIFLGKTENRPRVKGFFEDLRREMRELPARRLENLETKLQEIHAVYSG